MTSLKPTILRKQKKRGMNIYNNENQALRRFKMFDKLKELWNSLFGGKNVRKVKVKAKDIENNVLRIQKRIEWTHDEIDKITSKMAAIDRDTEEEEYKVLETKMKELNEMLGTLQKELEQEYTILKKYKDSRFAIAPKDAIIIGGVFFMGVFCFALERENPKALKLANFLLKIFPLHI